MKTLSKYKKVNNRRERLAVKEAVKRGAWDELDVRPKKSFPPPTKNDTNGAELGHGPHHISVNEP